MPPSQRLPLVVSLAPPQATIAADASPGRAQSPTASKAADASIPFSPSTTRSGLKLGRPLSSHGDAEQAKIFSASAPSSPASPSSDRHARDDEDTLAQSSQRTARRRGEDHDAMIERLRSFRHDASFTPEFWQLELICAMSAGWDGALIAGTGQGKRLLWEIAALSQPEKIFIVVVPLQAIEVDQVSKYHGTSISAIALSQAAMNGREDNPTSSKIPDSKTARRNLFKELREGRYGLVFASPEMLLTNPDLSSLLAESAFRSQVGGIFVDEAHVVADWGFRTDPGASSAFRPEYAKIRVIRARIGLETPCIALSATLPPSALKAVVTSLDLGRENLIAIDAGTDRPNISYEVHPLASNISDIHDLLRLFHPAYRSSSEIPKTLIYVRTRMEAYRAAALIAEFIDCPQKGFVCPFTSLSSEAYKIEMMQVKFRDGTVRIIVATEAGGMGIDIPDIDLIVQFSLPEDLQTLAQHFGRAMRLLSKPGRAILFASSWAFDPSASTFGKLAYRPSLPNDKASQLRRAKLKTGLSEFVNGSTCRRGVLIKHMKLDADFIKSHHASSQREIREHYTSDDDESSVSRPALAPSSPSDSGPCVAAISSSSSQRPTTVLMHASVPASHRTSIAVAICCDLCSLSGQAHSPADYFQINPPLPQSATVAVGGGSLNNRIYVPRAPPGDFDEMRRELASGLNKWRAAYFRTHAHHAFLDDTCLLSDQAIVNVVAHGVRLLAQHEYGGSPHLSAAHIRRILQSESVLMSDEDIGQLMAHLDAWLRQANSKYGRLVRKHDLTSRGETRREQSSQQSAAGPSSQR
ncbi:hypothetical protein V8E36_008821 [Tilletia maclaganii]